MLSESYKSTINEVFAIFRVNFHNQYYSAYQDTDLINGIKKLWANSLHHFDENTLIQAAQNIVKNSEYLPSLKQMLDACFQVSTEAKLPSARSAYLEACHAASPKQNAQWSHPAVYYAGKQSGWRMLASTDEKTAFPIFREHYQKICQELITSGRTLPEIQRLALPETTETPLSKAENSQRLAKLQSLLD